MAKRVGRPLFRSGTFGRKAGGYWKGDGRQVRLAGPDVAEADAHVLREQLVLREASDQGQGDGQPVRLVLAAYLSAIGDGMTPETRSRVVRIVDDFLAALGERSCRDLRP